MRSLAPVLLVACAACAPPAGAPDAGEPLSVDGGSPSADGGVVPRLQMGTGSVDFVPLQGGDEVELERGFQGGFHVWGAFRVRDVAPDDVAFRFELELADGVLAETGFVTDLWDASDGSARHELAGVTVFVLEEEPLSRDGEPGTFRARVEDARGEVVRGEVEVVVRCCEDLGVGGTPDAGPTDGEDAGPIGGGGQRPVINGFVQEPLVGTPGIPLSIAVVAFDPEGAELTYLWGTDVGELSAPTSDGLAWTVPEAGDYEIQVTVSDGVLTSTARTTVTFE